MFSSCKPKFFAVGHIHYPVNPPRDHFHTETVLPPSDHYCIDTVASSGNHHCIDIVVPSSMYDIHIRPTGPNGNRGTS